MGVRALQKKKHEKPIRVSKRNPCPICEKPDWCTLSADGTLAFCMRISSERKAGNGSFIHILADPKPPPAPLNDKHEWIPVEDWSEKAIECFRHPKAKAAREAVSERLELSEGTLEAMLVGWSADRRGEFTTWPEWKLYKGQMTITSIDRRYADGTKKCMKGGKRGMYVIEHWWVAAGPVLMPEGGSDAAALIDIGCCVVGRFACRGGVRDMTTLLRRFIGSERRIVVIGDNDDDPTRRGKIDACSLMCAGCGHCCPGRTGAVSVAEELASRLGRPVDARYIHWPSFMGVRPVDARDVERERHRWSMPELVERLDCFVSQ